MSNWFGDVQPKILQNVILTLSSYKFHNCL